jgi:hypothetical protein
MRKTMSDQKQVNIVIAPDYAIVEAQTMDYEVASSTNEIYRHISSPFTDILREMQFPCTEPSVESPGKDRIDLRQGQKKAEFYYKGLETLGHFNKGLNFLVTRVR